MAQTNTFSRKAQYSGMRLVQNKLTGETLAFSKSAADTSGAYVEFEVTSPAGFGGPPRHIHTRQEEAFKVTSGRLGIEVNGEKHVLGPGEEFVIPAGAAHSWWVEGDEPVKGWGRVTPALHFTEILDVITRSANAHNSETPSLVDAAIILTRYRDEYTPVFLPAPVRLIVLPLLAFIGRFNGRARVVEGWLAEHYR